MEATKGIHALATFIAILSTLWLLWGFISVLLDFPTDTVQGYLYWGSFAVLAFVTMAAVPYIIAMRHDATANIVSAYMAWGVWAFMAIINMLLFPFFNAMINIFTDINNGNASSVLVNTMQNGSLIVQLFSIFFLLVVIASLYLLPILTALNPHIITDTVKKRLNI